MSYASWLKNYSGVLSDTSPEYYYNSKYGVFGGIANYLSNVYRKFSGSGLTGAQMAANEYSSEEAEKNREFNAYEAQKQRDFEEGMANSSYQRTVADLQAAGLNPALAYGNAVDPTPSGSAASGSAPSSVSPSPAGGLLDLILQMKQLSNATKLNKANIQNIDADTELKKVQAEQTSRNVSWIDRLNQASLDYSQARTLLTSEEIQNVREHRNEIIENVKLLAQQAKSEEARQILMKAQSNLADMSSREIARLLPLRAALLEAQTGYEKAQASLVAANAAIQQGLVDEGYVFAVMDEIESRIKLNESGAARDKALAELDEFKRSAKTGELFHIDLTAADSGFVKAVEDYMNTVGAEGVFGAIGALFDNGLGSIVTGGLIGSAFKGQVFKPKKVYNSSTGSVDTYYTR